MIDMGSLKRQFYFFKITIIRVVKFLFKKFVIKIPVTIKKFSLNFTINFFPNRIHICL